MVPLPSLPLLLIIKPQALAQPSSSGSLDPLEDQALAAQPSTRFGYLNAGSSSAGAQGGGKTAAPKHCCCCSTNSDIDKLRIHLRVQDPTTSPPMSRGLATDTLGNVRV